ncbi:MAG: hypothetical protein KGZ96_04325 [Clostridia bacterium]|jgi:hypothetical protein|nr:hypothetical protein [Clostridia bacterium]
MWPKFLTQRTKKYIWLLVGIFAFFQLLNIFFDTGRGVFVDPLREIGIFLFAIAILLGQDYMGNKR